MPRRHMATRWDLENAEAQCRECNSFKGGMQDIFAERLGPKAEQLRIQAHETRKYELHELEDMLENLVKLNKRINGYF